MEKIEFIKPKKFFRVEIVKTSKLHGSTTDKFSCWDIIHKDFETFEEITKFVKETYNKCKTSKMYIDTKDGKQLQCGWIKHYIIEEYNNELYKYQKYDCQDWISVI